MSSTGEFIFSIGEANVTSIERAILSTPTSWLNDACITFFFETFREQLLSSKPENRELEEILFMNPSAAWMSSLISDASELALCLDQLSLATRQIVFIPVNDAQEPGASNCGSHWSLLVYFRASDTFYYMDSVRSSSNNRPYAQTIAKHVYPILKENTKIDSLKFFELETSVQPNGFDCGMYVISNAEALCSAFLEHGWHNDIAIDVLQQALATVSDKTVKSRRLALLETLDTLAARK